MVKVSIQLCQKTKCVSPGKTLYYKEDDPIVAKAIITNDLGYRTAFCLYVYVDGVEIPVQGDLCEWVDNGKTTMLYAWFNAKGRHEVVVKVRWAEQGWNEGSKEAKFTIVPGEPKCFEIPNVGLTITDKNGNVYSLGDTIDVSPGDPLTFDFNIANVCDKQIKVIASVKDNTGAVFASKTVIVPANSYLPGGQGYCHVTLRGYVNWTGVRALWIEVTDGKYTEKKCCVSVVSKKKTGRPLKPYIEDIQVENPPDRGYFLPGETIKVYVSVKGVSGDTPVECTVYLNVDNTTYSKKTITLTPEPIGIEFDISINKEGIHKICAVAGDSKACTQVVVAKPPTPPPKPPKPPVPPPKIPYPPPIPIPTTNPLIVALIGATGAIIVTGVLLYALSGRS